MSFIKVMCYYFKKEIVNITPAFLLTVSTLLTVSPLEGEVRKQEGEPGVIF